MTIKNPFSSQKQNIYNLLHPQGTPSGSSSASAASVSVSKTNSNTNSQNNSNPVSQINSQSNFSRASPPNSLSDSSLDNTTQPLRPMNTTESFMSGISRIESHPYVSANNLYSYCLGKPRNLISSHSGTVTLALSVQEPNVFLTCCPPGASSYRDLGVDSNGGEELVGVASVSTGGASGSAGAGADSGTGSTSTSTGAGTSTAPEPSRTPDRSVPADERISDQPPSTLRGSILLKLTKPTKLKQISLSFYGVSKTVWSQTAQMNPLEELHNQPGAEIQDTVFVNSHDWEFLPDSSTSQGCPNPDQSLTTINTDLYGADAILLKSDESNSVRVKDPSKSIVRHNNACRTVSDSNTTVPLFAPRTCPKRKLRHPATLSHKEAVLFPAGEYVYNFTLAIDANTPETVNVPHGSIQYFLVPKVVRTGPFALNLQGQQEIELIRSPPNNYDTSFNNPIVISRIWDNRLHYEIVIPQKYITLGTSIPVAIKLTPLEKVMVHRVRVQIYETIQYKYSPDPHIDSTEVAVKVTLYEKKATSKGVIELTDIGYSRTDPKERTSGKALPDYMTPTSSGGGSGSSSAAPTGPSSSNDTSGNNTGLSSSSDENIPAGSSLEGSSSRKKLCGNLLNSGDDYEIDCEESSATHFNCTIPLVSDKESWHDNKLPAQYLNIPGTVIANNTTQYLRPDAISSPYIRVRHRLVVSFRISKQDRTDEKRRHFEVKIDTPVNILSKQCISGNVELPQYYNNLLTPDLGNLPSFDDALAAITDDELYLRPILSDPPQVPTPPPEYSSLDFD